MSIETDHSNCRIIANQDSTALYPDSNEQKDQVSVPGDKISDLVVLELPKTNSQKKKSKKSKKISSTDDDTDSVSRTPVQRSQLNSPKPSNSQLKKLRNKRDEEWEDSTDMPEFDFQSNLAKFDKSSVFAELSLNDTIDPSQRLVGHNKTTKDNYEIDEMVKKPANWDQNWDSIKSEQIAIQKLTEKLNLQQLLKSMEREIPSRKSTVTPTSSSLFSLVKDGEKEKLPLASPINLLEIERLAQDEYGYDSSLILENAGRGLSLVIMKILGADTSRINSSNERFNVNSPPLVLLLVGNNRTGAKALNTGRQLANHGLRVISLLINDNDGDDELVQLVSDQLELFESFGGKTVYNLSQLQNILKQVDSPLELIVDGLQGFDTNISDLMDTELSKALTVIKWANSHQCYKLSIDMPSGIDAGSGQLQELDSPFIESKFIVSMGLPLTALLHAYSNGLVQENVHYLVDIGIPRKIFQRGSLRKFDRSWFSSDWNVKLNVINR